MQFTTLVILSTDAFGHCGEPSVFSTFIYLYMLRLQNFYTTFRLHVFSPALNLHCSYSRKLVVSPMSSLASSVLFLHHLSFCVVLEFEHACLGYLSQPPISLTEAMSWYPIRWKVTNLVFILFPPLLGCIAICGIFFISLSYTFTVYDKGQLFLKSSDFRTEKLAGQCISISFKFFLC